MIYQNLDSFMNVPHKTTGSFYIDYDMEYVQVFERVDSIPMAPAEE